jgi:hypothetical protein
MNKLEILDISNTDIESGLEYLPASLEEIICHTNQRSEASCRLIQEQLAGYEKKYFDKEYGEVKRKGTYDYLE